MWHSRGRQSLHDIEVAGWPDLRSTDHIREEVAVLVGKLHSRNHLELDSVKVTIQLKIITPARSGWGQ